MWVAPGLGAPGKSGPVRLPPPADREVDFAREVAPLLQDRCFLCHGPRQQMKGLRLDRREDALRGSESGPVILPGNSADSRLIQLIAGTNPTQVMPPDGDGLTAEQVGTLRAWIDQGAQWSTPETADSHPGAQEAESSHWAFRPIRRAPVPEVGGSNWARNPIDHFIQKRLEAEGIESSPEADRATLIRRLSLDLIGLPPNPREVAEFLADASPHAYERQVSRLLNSPHFGEKWARYWLDLARYSDSDGYRGDGFRPHAWRYRHWVIEAFNRDMPFDRFTLEQIAGDLLAGATAEQKVGTGFHRNTASNREGGVDMNQFRHEQVVNRVKTVGTTWLGLTVGCAQCHDHKYDPLSHKEYYQFFAYFNDAEEVNVDAPLPGERGPFLKEVAAYRKKRRELLEEYGVPGEQPPWEAKLLEAMANPGKWQNWDKAVGTLRVGVSQGVYGMGEKILRTTPEQRNEKETVLLTNHFVWHSSRGLPVKRYKEELKYDELWKKLQELDQAFPALSQAQTLATEKDPRRTHIHPRGDFKRLGDPVEPAIPGFLQSMADSDEPPRLRLAGWLIDPTNPLTARVAVNRLWQELFGRGIVPTPEDFGTQGEKPSHPLLLDWLASDFRDGGWSMKESIRGMVVSATYRQDSAPRPELASVDPNNALLARQSRVRLSAELIRDSALAVSGLLHPVIGGKSVRPPQPEGGQTKGKWVESQGKDRYRRGLYIQIQRMAPYPFLLNFDLPPAYASACRRGRSNTALQALNLLNDPVFFEAAQGLALRVLTEAPARLEDRLDHAFRLCLAREPDPSERQWLATAIRRQEEILEEELELARLALPADLPGVSVTEAAAWVGASRVLLNLDEFITRE